MQCVILAGGLGTRVRSVSESIPKTLLPVAGRPFAHWQLSWLADGDVDSVVYCIGHLGGQVRDVVGDGSDWRLEVAYVDEGEELRGTAGALGLAARQGLLDERFLVLYGDSWLQVHPGTVFRASQAGGLPALMTVLENHDRWDHSNAVYRDGLVVRYEKGLDPLPPDMAWIDYGLSVLTRDVVADRVPTGARSDLAPLMSDLAAEGRLAGLVVPRRFYEIGSPEGLAELDALLDPRRVHPSPDVQEGRP